MSFWIERPLLEMSKLCHTVKQCSWDLIGSHKDIKKTPPSSNNIKELIKTALLQNSVTKKS